MIVCINLKNSIRNHFMSCFIKGNHSILKLDLHMRRSVGYYLVQGYIPAGLLVILSWISFWIDCEATADRVYIGLCTKSFHSFTYSIEISSI